MTAPMRHLPALRSRLEADHYVKFKNGAQVEFEDCVRCRGDGKIDKPGRHKDERRVRIECPVCRDGEGTRLMVTSPQGRQLRFLWPDELRRAYEQAADGDPRKAQPVGAGKFGEDAPW